MPDQDRATPDLASLSNQLADAVQAAAAATLSVAARRGPPASGIAFAPDLVLTADHVVDPAFEREGHLRVGLPDGGLVTATVAGRDPATDLALLRLADGSITPATPAEAEPRVGSLALLVARPGPQSAASLGLIVGLGGPARTRRGGLLERFIHVDGVMYPGFSGGPLVDARGAVLGLNTSGLGFGGPSVAIPWQVAGKIARALAEHGRVARGYLGVGSQPIALSAAAQSLLQGSQERGLLVLHVADGGPAASAGVLQGDILVRLAGQPVEHADDLQALLGPERVGAAVTATVVRGGELRDLSITVGQRS